MSNERCSARVYAGTFVGHPCSKKVKVTRNGKPYCAIHDPIAVAAKRKKREKKRDQEWADREKREEEQEKRAEEIERLCGHISTDDLHNYRLVRS